MPAPPWDWPAPRRRDASIVVLAAVVAVVLFVLAVWLLAPGAFAPAAWTGAALVAALLAFEAMVVVRRSELEPVAGEEPIEAGDAPVFRETLLSVKCGDCGTQFETPETGTRPLYATCPGCGARTVLLK